MAPTMGFGLVFPNPLRASIKAFSMKISSSKSISSSLRSQFGWEDIEDMATHSFPHSSRNEKVFQYVCEEEPLWTKLRGFIIPTVKPTSRLESFPTLHAKS
jgi:hypothetical protein